MTTTRPIIHVCCALLVAAVLAGCAAPQRGSYVQGHINYVLLKSAT